MKVLGSGGGVLGMEADAVESCNKVKLEFEYAL